MLLWHLRDRHAQQGAMSPTCMTRGWQASISCIMSRVRKKLAPMRSILLTKQMRGTLYLQQPSRPCV